MLEVGMRYTKPEMTRIFGTKDKQGLERKMKGYGIEFSVSGRGESAIYKIEKMSDPFKIFAITELECGANTDFKKLRNFYWYYFNDEIFMAMPDERKETMLTEQKRRITRQTIAAYTQKLIIHNLITTNHYNFIYYFAYKETQRIVDKKEYSQAWKEYWANRDNGMDSGTAISIMRFGYGGIARKQPIPEVNGIYNYKIDEMLTYIQQSMENDL